MTEQDDSGTPRYPMKAPEGHSVSASLRGSAEVLELESEGYVDWRPTDLGPDGAWICECGERLPDAEKIAEHWLGVRDE